MNILILGPQGSGKGTQAKMLADKYGLFYFESGEVLRNLAKKDKKLDEIVNKIGVLVPDPQMFLIATGYLETHAPTRDNILMEGYPRSQRQYFLIKGWLAEKGKSINCAIFLEISEEESIRRLSARREDPATGKIYNLITEPPPAQVSLDTLVQREDDKPEAIKARLNAYKKSTLPLVSQLKREGILFAVNGERPIEVIFDEISEIVERRTSEQTKS